MGQLDVRIVDLPPVRVAVAHGSGEHPEGQAWRAIMAFAKSHGLVAELKSHRFFGFNNPEPSPDSPGYGYDQCMTIQTSPTAEDQVKIIDLSGGRYAVTRCRGAGNLGTVWKQLAAWQQRNHYDAGPCQCLEEVLNPEAFVTTEGGPSPDDAWDKVLFDLYLPLAE